MSIEVNMNEKMPLYFSNGVKLVEIQVTSDEAITIADTISQISMMSAEKRKSYKTMDILLAITNKKALMKHTEVTDED